MPPSITPTRIARILGLSPSIASRLKNQFGHVKTYYRTPNQAERDEYLLLLLEFIKQPGTARDRDENRSVWARGWQEHLNALRRSGISPAALKPKYFRDCKFLRWQNSVILPENPQLEHDLFSMARRLLFAAHLQPFTTIYEIGSGSGQNLLMLAEMFPDKELVGLDWVEPAVQIANRLGRALNRKISGRVFNMFDPPPTLHLAERCAVITIHAMEQIGDNHGSLLDYFLAEKPSMVLNYEPVAEFYDPTNVMDFLALWYSERRNYLRGYLTALRRLESEKRIEILQAHRPGLGGVCHEASLLIWRPRAELRGGK